MIARPISRVRFGDCEVDFDAFTLTRAGVPIPVQRQPFDVLAVLLAQPGRVITRQELREQLWDDSFVDFDHSLNIAINKLRAALNDSADHPRYIETVPRRGYRFIGTVDLDAPDGAATAAAAPASVAEGDVAPAARHRRQPRVVIVASLLGLAVAVAVAAWGLSPGARVRHPPPPANAAAVEEYERGRAGWNARTDAALHEAIQHFIRATELEPTYAAAFAGLADCYTTLGYLSNIEPADGFQAARVNAEHALRLDPELAEPHASLGYVHLYYDWDWAAADREFRLAMDADPNLAIAHQWYAVFLTAMGRPGEARKEVARAQALDPLSPAIATDIGFQLYYTRQYDAAIVQLGSITAVNPGFPFAHLWRGRAYQQQHRFDDAITEFEAVQRALPEWPVAIAARASVEGWAGRREDVRSAIAQLDALSQHRYVTAYAYALAYAALDRPDEALAWLQRGVKERTPWMVWLKIDPRWGVLSSDRRFVRIASEVGLP